jgi:two-component system, NtrC family, nitrogen regulation response regulator GlnG
MPKLLIVDDEEALCYSFRRVLSAEGAYEVRTAGTAAEGLEVFQSEGADVVVLDLQLPDRSGLELFYDLRQRDAHCPIIFMTAHGTADTAIEAMKHGAFDYQVKPVDLEQFTQLLRRAFEAARLMRVPALLPTEDEGDRIIATCRAMQEMCKTIGRLAPQDVTVLICGESGTGKELVARALYHHSRRADAPFLAINCAAIPETLLESELFGHEKGAFTGADRRRIGKFEQCDGGTLFLDEIGDMPLALQAKMLRILQDQHFARVGGQETVQTNVRLLAATNQDLPALVEAGRFRSDLYYRLSMVKIDIPPLRVRQGDLEELAHEFLFRYAREMSIAIQGFAPETLELLRQYSWPGNVRELQGVIRQALLTGRGHVLLPEFLPENLRCPPQPPPESQDGVSAVAGLKALAASLLHKGGNNIYAEAVAALEHILLPCVLRHTGNHRTRASELLGISRATLSQKLRSQRLTIGLTVVENAGDEETAGEPT